MMFQACIIFTFTLPLLLFIVGIEPTNHLLGDQAEVGVLCEQRERDRMAGVEECCSRFAMCRCIGSLCGQSQYKNTSDCLDNSISNDMCTHTMQTNCAHLPLTNDSNFRAQCNGIDPNILTYPKWPLHGTSAGFVPSHHTESWSHSPLPHNDDDNDTTHDDIDPDEQRAAGTSNSTWLIVAIVAVVVVVLVAVLFWWMCCTGESDQSDKHTKNKTKASSSAKSGKTKRSHKTSTATTNGGNSKKRSTKAVAIKAKPIGYSARSKVTPGGGGKFGMLTAKLDSSKKHSKKSH